MRATVIFLSPTPPPFMGPSVATHILLKSRFVREFRVIHIDTADRRSLETMAQWDVTNIGLALKHYIRLFWTLLSRRSDAVYIPISQTASGFLRDMPFVFLAKIFRKKTVLHLRGGYFGDFYRASSGWMRGLIRSTLMRVDRMIVLGSSLKTVFLGLISEEKISVVPNGLDFEDGTDGDFDRPKKARGEDAVQTVLFLSNLIKSKGFMEVLAAAPRVIQRRKQIQFVFAGEWINRADRLEFGDYVGLHSLRDVVVVRGVQTGEEKMKLYRNADIFVFPTYYPFEGHPWVIIEAMAAGLPIITTNQGCIAESVIDGDNGFIIPKRNPEAIVEKILFLLDHPEVGEKMGRRSRELYEANFTEEHFVRRMIDVIYLALNSVP